MMHSKKGENKKKGIRNPSYFSLFSFVAKQNYSTHHHQQMNTYTNPLNLRSQKEKKKEHITMESLLTKTPHNNNLKKED
jgi:hypothetical protein